MHVLAECTLFLKQLSSERKYRAVFHLWRNDKRFCPPLKCICNLYNLYKIGMLVEVWSTHFMKDSFGSVSVFTMAWPCKKRICFGHVIDPLLTNPLRSIWPNVGLGCFFFFFFFVCFVLFLSLFVSFFFCIFVEREEIRGPYKRYERTCPISSHLDINRESKKIIEER